MDLGLSSDDEVQHANVRHKLSGRVTADEAAGEEMLGAGPSEEELRKMPIRELRALAKERGVDVSGCLEKGDFVDALRAPTDE